MDYTVFVGNITPEGDRLLSSFIDKFLPNTTVVPLQPRDARVQIKLRGADPTVHLIIIDEGIYDSCIKVAKDILTLPKVHIYRTDDELRQFLVSKYGDLDRDLNETGRGISNIVTAPDFSDAVAESSGVIDELEKKIESLESQLTQERTLVRSLSQQLQDNDGNESGYVSRIRELSDELKERDEELAVMRSENENSVQKLLKAEKSLSEISELKEKLKSLGDSKSKLEYEKSKLEENISSLESSLSSSKSVVSELNEEVSNLKSALEELEESRGRDSEKDIELERLHIVASELDIVREELNSRTRELEELRGSSSKAAELADMVTVLEGKCEELESQVVTLKSDLKSSNELYESTRSELEIKSKRFESDSEELEQLRLLKQEHDTISLELSAKVSEVENLTKLVDDKTREISRLNNEILIYKDTEEINKTAIQSVNKAKADMEMRVVVLEDEKTKLQLSVDGYKSDIDNLKLEVLDLTTRNNSILSELNEYKELAVNLTETEDKLLEEKRNNSRLKAENEVLKQSAVDSSEVMELRIEVNRLNAELEMAHGVSCEDYESLRSELEVLRSEREHGVSCEDYESVRSELEEARGRCSKLELDLASANESYDAISGSVFGSFYDNMSINIDFNVSLPLEFTPTDKPKFACIASGSSDGYVEVYNCIKNFVASNPRMRIILLDLVIDSKVDSSFGAKAIANPAEWLVKGGSPASYVSSCNISCNNLKVITPGFHYFNELALLGIDWSSRLKELSQTPCDLVILNVGNLTGVVPKVLFNTFKSFMRSHIVTLGTPDNLRTTCYVVSSLRKKDFCVNCVVSSARSMSSYYEKLASLCNCRLLDKKDRVQFI